MVLLLLLPCTGVLVSTFPHQQQQYSKEKRRQNGKRMIFALPPLPNHINITLTGLF